MIIQFTFFILLIVALFAGALGYFKPTDKPINPIKFVMHSIGYDSEQSVNTKKTQQFNVSVDQGLMKIRSKIDDIAVQQDKFMDALKDQQAILSNSGRNINDLMLAADSGGRDNDKDILQLKALGSQIQDEQQLLVTHGQALVALNDQLTRNRQLVAQQIDLANINTQNSVDTMQQNYASLQNQALGLFDKVVGYNQQVNNSMDEIVDFYNLAHNVSYGNYTQQQNIEQRLKDMRDKENEEMSKVADNQQKQQELLQDAKDKLADSQQLASDQQQKIRDLIDQENQKQADQEALAQERIADQQQRMQDQVNR